MQESDTTSLRNAFVMLQATSPQRAVEYFLSIYEQIPGLDEMMQLAVIELIRKESKAATSEGGLKVRSYFLTATSVDTDSVMRLATRRLDTSSAFSSF